MITATELRKKTTARPRLKWIMSIWLGWEDEEC